MSVQEPAELHVEMGTYGLKQLVVNGKDLTESCRSVRIDVESGAVPVVSLQMLPGPFELDGPGVVMIQSQKMSAVDFLKSIDASYVERKSLEAADWGSSPGELFLKVLIEMAEELS